MTRLWGAVLVLAAALPAGGQTTAPASQADRLAADALRHSAQSLIFAPAGAPTRAGRLIALTEYAKYLDPGDMQLNSLLTDIYESEGRVHEAAAAALEIWRHQPGNHAVAQLWLRLALACQETAQDRLDLIERQLKRTDLSKPMCADLQTAAGQIYVGQGDREHAIQAFREALKFDPYNALAIEGIQAAVIPKPALPQRTADMLDILRGDPQAVDIIWELAQAMETIGLHEQAGKLFDQANTLIVRRGGTNSQPLNFIIAQFNAMLDDLSATKAQEAVLRFAPAAERFTQSIDLQSLLAEAYVMAGASDKGATQNAILERLLKDLDRPAARRSTARELAAFFTYNVDKPYTALAYANVAVRNEPEDDVARRLLACAQVKTERQDLVEEGLKTLNELYERDAFAALCLAERYYANNEPQKGAAAAAAGLKLSRTGPAYRRLAALAARQKLQLPSVDGADEITALYEKFDQRYLQMSLTPEKFVQVSVKGVRDTIGPGESVEVSVTLTNRSELDVPLGREGLLSPAVSFEVKAAGATTSYAGLPMAAIPAPRYLPPGQSVSCRVRLDVGAFESFLKHRPMDATVIEVDATVDPVQVGAALQSTVPTLKVEPAIIRRTDLIGLYGLDRQDMAKSYQAALGYVVRDMKQGSPEERLRAAAIVGSLLTYADDVARGATIPPRDLAPAIKRPVMLSMCNALLQDPSPVVRAEMTAQLEGVRVDDTLTALLAPPARDADPLVRFRLAELLGPSRDRLFQRTVGVLASDSDEHVRSMAAAFIPAKPQEAPPVTVAPLSMPSSAASGPASAP